MTFIKAENLVEIQKRPQSSIKMVLLTYRKPAEYSNHVDWRPNNSHILIEIVDYATSSDPVILLDILQEIVPYVRVVNRLLEVQEPAGVFC